MNFLTFGTSFQCKNKEHVNQDRFGSVTVKTPMNQEIIIAAISDGVTMCYKSEVASYNAIRFVLNWGANYFSENEFDTKIIPSEFDNLIKSINQNLIAYSVSQKRKKLNEGYSQFTSCTLCCLITDGNQILYFAIGDSGIYELREYETIDIMGTDDENKHRNEYGKLTSFIGGIHEDNLDIRFKKSRFDDSATYLLCSDGLYNRMPIDVGNNDDFRIFNKRLLSEKTRNSGVTILEGMTKFVINQGETDDITVLVIKKI